MAFDAQNNNLINFSLNVILVFIYWKKSFKGKNIEK